MLKERKEYFSHLGGGKICDLIKEFSVPSDLFSDLKTCVALYMSKSAMLKYTHLDEVLSYYEKNQVQAVTPNGLIVPKKHSTLEFNLLSISFYNIINHFGLHRFIKSWNVPLNLRIKTGKFDMTRRRASEHPHSDSWAGEFSFCGTAMLPISGDLESNNVLFFEPPDSFDEEWLKPLTGYDEGKEIVKQYTPLDYKPKAGKLIISDFSTIHASKIYKEGGARISIDTTFSYRDSPTWRGQRLSPKELTRLGHNLFFQFNHDVNDKVDSQGGFKQPVNLAIHEF